MKGFQFKGLLNNTDWISPAYVNIDAQGLMTNISAQPTEDIDYELVDGYALPGITNAHSHAFQYAMCGLTETHFNSAADNFWSWRTKMYELALTISPEELEDIASMLYSEMTQHGYTHVTEFHYLHHDKNGHHFDDKAEMSQRLIAAAARAGINITLIPIFYQKGGFGKDALKEQRRFISKNTDDYNGLWEACHQACLQHDHTTIGYGIHSLRAVEPSLIPDFLNTLRATYPIHLHISEQLKEIEDSISYLKARPVEWLLENVSVDSRYHLVHATHMTEVEATKFAASKAHVVLCPSTEGNLGDGLFKLKTFQENGGHWSIGTDSHIGLSPFEELRILDYGQRTLTHRRDSFSGVSNNGSALYALNQIISSGRQSTGRTDKEFFSIGQGLDAIVIDASHPLISSTSLTHLADTIIYSSTQRMIKGVIVNGKWIVQDGRHINKAEIYNRFESTMKSLQYR